MLSIGMRLTARQIELFHMAYLHRSTRKAAEALHISQPAISRVVAELEAEMGVALFDRTGRRFEPTAAAHSLQQAVQRHFQGLERVRETALQIASGTGGHLCIAAVPAVADIRVAAAAGHLMALHADLRIDIDVMGEEAGLAALREGRVDCAVISSDPGDANLHCRRLADIQPVAIFPANHSSEVKQEVTVAELAKLPLVMLPKGSPFRRAVEKLFDQAGVSLRVRAEARTQTAIAALVAEGAGCAIVDAGVLTPAVSARVQRADLTGGLSWPVRSVTTSASCEIPILRRFQDALS